MLSVPKGEIMCQDILELFLLVIKIELAASESHNNSLFSFCASFTNTKGREQTLLTVQLCSLLLSLHFLFELFLLSMLPASCGVNGEGRKKSRGNEWLRLSEVNYNTDSSDVRLYCFSSQILHWSTVQKNISTNQKQCWLFSHHTHIQHLLALINSTNTPFMYLCFSFCSSSWTLFSLQCSTLGQYYSRWSIIGRDIH